MKKKFSLFVLLFALITCLLFSYSEDGNGYPHSYDTGAYGGGNSSGNGSGSGSGGSGDASGGNQDGQGGGGYSEDKTGAEITQESDALSSQVDGEESAVNDIQTGDSGEGSDSAADSAADTAASHETALNSDTASAAAESDGEVNSNTSASQDEGNSSNSTAAGDPVKISKGTYELSETDLYIGSNKLFAIKRRYESEKPVTGSFGFGWHTNLDERIILGIAPTQYKDIKALMKYMAEISKLILQTECRLSEQYRVSNIYSAHQEIMDRISSCEEHIENLETIISDLDKLKKRAAYYFSLNKKIEGIKERALCTKREAENKKQLLESSLEKIGNDLEILAALKQKLQNAQVELEEKNYFVTINLQRHIRNKKAMFAGMSKMYEETGIDTITVIDDEGYPHILKERNGIWESEKDKLYLRCEKKENQLILYEKNGTIKYFDENGLLVSVMDRNENTVELIRDSAGKIQFINTSDNEKFTFEYAGDYISKIVNSRATDEKTEYEYQGNRLVCVKDTDGDFVQMNYDSEGHLTALHKCDGSFVAFSYGEQTREGKTLTTVTTNEEGYSEYFEYNITDKRTDYVDHDGNRYSYFYDDKHRTIKEIHPDGRILQNEYDSTGNLICQNINGSKVYYEYDENANKTWAIYDDGTTEKWTYDSLNLETSYINRDGVLEEFLRDSKGNLIEYRKGGKIVYTSVYDLKGNVIRQTVYCEKPVITEYQYDSFSNLISETCGNYKQEYKYDNRNRIVNITVNGKVVSEYSYKIHEVTRKDYNGLSVTCITNGRKDVSEIIQKDLILGKTHKLHIEYDKRHLPVKLFIGDGNNETLRAKFSYSPEGKLISEVLYGKENIVKEFNYTNGHISEQKQYKEVEGSGSAFVTRFNTTILNRNQNRLIVTDSLGIQNVLEYDSNGKLLKKVDGNGEVLLFNYSGAGLITSAQTSFGGWYEYAYDSSAKLISQKEKGGIPVQTTYFPDGSLKSVTNRYGITTVYHYDNLGRVICVENKRQRIWFEYDAFNRIIKKWIGPDTNDTSAIYYEKNEYSADGRYITEIKGGKYKTVKELDAFGNIIKIIDGENNERSFVYNEQNQLIESFDGYENQTMYEYDATGKLSRVIAPDSTETAYKYNAIDQLIEVTDNCGYVYTAEYDAAGRLIKEKNRAEAEKCYEYDRAGRVTKVFCGNEVLEAYKYGDKGQTVTVTDGNNNSYQYLYDSFGRLISEQNRKKYDQKYAYDAAGGLKTKTDFAENLTNVSYSSDRSIRTMKYSDGSKIIITYDAVGNIIETENNCEHTIYRYDQACKLINQKELISGEEISYDYDNAGNRTRLISSNRETIYTFGKNNELKEIFDNKQRLSVKLAYDKNGREVLRKYGNGTKEEILYDKAGRIILKKLLSGRNELMWCEGYVYGDDGKRLASVDNDAHITLYEYNVKGQLSSVFYPYSEELINNQKTEAILNGLPVSAEAGENRFLSTAEKTAIIPLLNSMQNGLAYKLTNLQVFIKESYSYDANGNRISKTTPYGTIEYSYDKENCLTSSGTKGQVFVKYISDKMGNLITEESAMKKVEYAYNSRNRLIYCASTNEASKTYVQTAYDYDAFGRRVLVQDKGSPAIRTLYDGMSFEVIKEGPVYVNGIFTDSSETAIRWGKSGRPTGERYRYLTDEDSTDGSRYFYLDDENYKNVSSRYYGERTQLYVNNTMAAQCTGVSGTEYFSTDLCGSIRSTTDSYGTIKAFCSYDAFGSIVQGNLSGSMNYGYLAKSQDPTTLFYNYGYRDYNPTAARFTTVDPIRDSTNWFAYCNSDPVNFVDPNGLFFYGNDGQHSITEIKQTTVVIIRNSDGTGNSFDSTRYIYKDDGINTTLVYVDTVGANCKEEYNGTEGSTTPDGSYYLTTGTLTNNGDGTYNSKSYENVLALATNDPNLTQEQRDTVNAGDRLFHANQFANATDAYNSNETPGGAGCIIGKNGQKQQDEMMDALMDGVTNPESIVVNIRSFQHERGCGK